MGNKNRISKYILPIILRDRTTEPYVEPFCGGLGTMDKVLTGRRIASDYNKYLIAMWQGLQLDLPRPREIPKELYDRARIEFNNGTNIEFSDFEIGWIGWMASFNGRFFDGGYSGTYKNRNYIDEQIRNTEKQIPLIKDIEFIYSNYLNLKIPPKSIIYCDIPYKNTKQYSISKNFDHEKFYQWCIEKHSEGHKIFISEYEMPDEFECVWEMEITNAMATKNTYKPIEKLFIVK